ncbi:MAG: hypothetical protein AAF705_04405 [Bacteroidota bacterium]
MATIKQISFALSPCTHQQIIPNFVPIKDSSYKKLLAYISPSS